MVNSEYNEMKIEQCLRVGVDLFADVYNVSIDGLSMLSFG